MILVDSSVWIDHLRQGDPRLIGLLETSRVLAHPFVVGELALGSLRHRKPLLDSLDELPRAAVAAEGELLDFIERHRLFGLGIGFVDAHLLAAIRLTPGSRLWTRDKSLGAVADRLGLAAGF
jgi:predicted nucleic acid-binding protein